MFEAYNKHPPVNALTLAYRNIYIFPTLAGLLYIIFMLALLGVAINYENNLVYASSFLLLGLFLICVIHTYRNLHGLSIHVVGSKPCFAAQQTYLTLKVRTEHLSCAYAFTLNLAGMPPSEVQQINHTASRINLKIQFDKRGLHPVGQLYIETTFPLGLIRAWAFVPLKATILVYPKPMATRHELAVNTDLTYSTGQEKPQAGLEDFDSISHYRPGDSTHRIAWKHYARGQGLLTKHFTEPQGQKQWLDWRMFQHHNKDRRASKLCYLALECETNKIEYGLKLPNKTIQPSVGEAHKQNVLKALALY